MSGSPPPFFVEVLPNLNVCYVIAAAATGAVVASPAGLSVGAQIVPLPTPAQTLGPVRPTTVAGDHVLYRVALQPPAGAMHRPTTAAEDETRALCAVLEGPRPLCCCACRHGLMGPSGVFKAALPLPQEGWDELVGYLSCHEELNHLASVNKMARPGLCLIGDTYLLLHPDDVNLARLAIALDLKMEFPTLQSVYRTSVSCQRCLRELGEALVGAGHVPVHLRLWRRAVVPTAAPGSAAVPLVVPLAAEILSFSRVQCSNRLFLTAASSEGKEFFILLWILNPDTLVACGENRSPVCSLVPAARVLYTAAIGTATDIQRSLASTWSSDDGVLDRECPVDDLCVLARHLLLSSAQLPPSRRKSADAALSVGYLQHAV